MFASTGLQHACYVRCVLRGLTTLCGCVLLVLSMPAAARAYEDQITLGVGAGYANAVADALPDNGVIADVALSFGLSAAWSLRGRVSYALHPADEPLHVVLAGAEVLYLLDIVEVVPYFGLGIDALGRIRAGDLQVAPATHAVVGVDYLLSRDLTLGLDLRAHLLPTELDEAPLYIAAVAAVTFMFY